MSAKKRVGRRSSSSQINSERLRFILAQKKLTITKLSQLIGYDRSGLSKSINKGYMDNQMIEEIGRVLDIDPQALLVGYVGTFVNLTRYHTSKDENGNDLPPYSSYEFDKDQRLARRHFQTWLYCVSENIESFGSSITVDEYFKLRKEDIYPSQYEEGIEIDSLMTKTIKFISKEISLYAVENGINTD